MNNKRTEWIWIAVLGVTGACGGGDSSPSATVAEFAPTSLVAADDSLDDLTIRVDYQDGDGDLGEGIAAVHDCRVADLVALYDVPKIASDDAVSEGVPIEGSIDIVLADITVLSPDLSAPAACAELGVGAPVAGEAVFCVVLTDASGNTGDGDCTGSVLIE